MSIPFYLKPAVKINSRLYIYMVQLLPITSIRWYTKQVGAPCLLCPDWLDHYDLLLLVDEVRVLAGVFD